MFTTYPSAEITFDGLEQGSPHGAQRVWSFVEQELLLPWFYVQVVRRTGGEDFASMLMLYHAHELKQWTDNQSNRMRVEQVQVVTPPHMNGQSTWLMEPLMMAGIVEDPRDHSHYLIYQVESGTIYSLRDKFEPDVKPFVKLFLAEQDLRKVPL
ncbi:hypothetical protein [Pseudomonas veronii]|uniref:hypothetical protein n=1 Tax=Pseudomonas veronii TaxID=76761 RepID=UPI002D78584E|nr:hypothetical protein [Pseudomonas veronii]WRU62670.1 hypothetical protein VPH48_31580 [Pseudomonas veronii]